MSALDVGLLLLGLVTGLTLAGHGAQKALGWFGGPGMRAWTASVASMGFAPAGVFAWAGMLGELLGGLGLALGVLTPLAAALVTAQMVVIIFHVHWRQGFWNTKRGIEYPLVLAAVAVFLGLVGRGMVSLDHIVSPTELLPAYARIALLLAGAGAGAIALAAGARGRTGGPERRPASVGSNRAGTGSTPR